MRYDVKPEELRDFLHAHRIKSAAADRLAKVNAGRTQSYLLGRSKPNPEYLDNLVVGMGLARSWEEYEPSKPQTSRVIESSEEPTTMLPYAGVVPASTDWGDPLSGTEMMRVDKKFGGERRFVAKVRGNSCFPLLIESDFVVFENDAAPPPGTIVLAQRKGDHGCTVKLLEMDPATGIPTLVPINPETDPPDQHDGWGAVAKVVGVIRDVEGADMTIYHKTGVRPKMIPVFGTSIHPSALGEAKKWADELKGQRMKKRVQS